MNRVRRLLILLASLIFVLGAPGFAAAQESEVPDGMESAQEAAVEGAGIGFIDVLKNSGVVGTVLWLLSDASAFTTGQTISVDGGTVFL